MATKKAPTPKAGTVVYLKTSAIQPDPDQPRKAFDEKALQALADNIRERDVQQPILVRQVNGKTLIVDGERRWRAAKLAKLTVVPTLRIESAAADQLRLDQVSLNQLREQLKPMEMARVLKGLRDQKFTANDIAARLAKQGHKAMTSSAIDQLVALTALPDWAQDMIDRDEIEPKAAATLLQILPRKGVEKPLKKSLERAAGYGGRILGHQVKNAGESALLESGAIDVTRVESWRGPNLVHFDWKTRCKGCEHLVRWGDGAFCVAAKLFAEHNQEAKDAGLLPGGKRPVKEPAAGSAKAEKQEHLKAQVREQSLELKARDYLQSYLITVLQIRAETDPKLPGVLCAWAALDRPGGVYGPGRVDDQPAARRVGLKSLAAVYQADGDTVNKAIREAAQDILVRLGWRDTQALGRLIFGDAVESFWKLDMGFLDLMRKAELVKLATAHGLDLPEGRRSWEALKTEELKESILGQAARVIAPDLLQNVYTDVPEWIEEDDDEYDFKPGSEDGDDLEDEAA